jgi:ATP-dependent RNA helicase RhlE
MSFASLGLRDDVLPGVRQLGFTRPTPVQLQTIPPALAGKDVLACAMTGSGKTAAFLLPILQRLSHERRRGPRALVLTPTRELAAQVGEHLRALSLDTRLTSATVFGGVGMGPQERAFRDGVDVIVATPGRLLDHLRSSHARLHGVEVLVLDEADRMLDMGFLPDVGRILRHLPERRQTLFFSATMPPPITALAREMLREPVTIALEREARPAAGITHAAYPVAAELKSALLVALVKSGTMRSVIAFTRTKHRANRLADYLTRNGVSADRIHGNRSQAQRTQALDGFKAGRFPVLVATDIAARGIDVDALSHVVNFDVPRNGEDFVHRVGRTARASAKGDAFVLVSPAEEADLRSIERAIGQRLPRVTLPGFDYSRRPAEKLEVPIAERLARFRAGRAQAGRRERGASAPWGNRHRSHAHPGNQRERGERRRRAS